MSVIREPGWGWRRGRGRAKSEAGEHEVLPDLEPGAVQLGASVPKAESELPMPSSRVCRSSTAC